MYLGSFGERHLYATALLVGEGGMFRGGLSCRHGCMLAIQQRSWCSTQNNLDSASKTWGHIPFASVPEDSKGVDTSGT